MNVETIRRMLTRQPFEAVRVKTSNGKTFEIRHPEMASLTKSVLIIVHPDADGGPSDKVEYVSYLHITSMGNARRRRFPLNQSPSSAGGALLHPGSQVRR